MLDFSHISAIFKTFGRSRAPRAEQVLKLPGKMALHRQRASRGRKI